MLNIYEQVSQNKLRSNILIGFFVSFITIATLVVTDSLNLDPSFTYFAFAFSAGSSLISFFYGHKIVLGLNKAKLASKQDYFDYYTAVENISLVGQIPTPKVYIIKSPALNAFATGNSPQNAIICVTTGLLKKLNKSEIEAVIAHEISHIKNYDIRLMTVVSILLGTLTITINSIRRNSIRTKNKKDSNTTIQALGIFLIMFAPIIARLIQLAISRQREYLADSSGVKLTRQPQSLISALQKIGSDPNILKQASTATANLYINNPFKGNKLASIFFTHPPIEKRVEALRQML